MAKGGGGGRGGGNDDIAMMALYVGLVAILSVVFWMTFRTPIVLFLYAVDVVQYLPLYYGGFLDAYSTGEFLHCVDTLRWILHPVHNLNQRSTIDPLSITLETLGYVQADVGARTWPFYSVLIGWFAYKTHRDMLGDRMRRKFSVTGRLQGKASGVSFMAFQSRIWTPALFTTQFKVEERSYFTEPPMRIMEFLRTHKITLTRKNGLDTTATERVFLKQIGRRWTGYKNEPFYVRAFLLMCMVILQLNEKEANALCKSLDRTFYSGKPPKAIETEVNAILEDIIAREPKLIEVIDEVASGHAYANTACLGVIGYCGPFRHWNGGQGSMIPPPMYQWVMLHDRILYLALQSHGRHGLIGYIEAAGVISHYQLERLIGSAKPIKYAQSAVNAVKEWLEKHEIRDMAEFDRARKNTQRRYKVRQRMDAQAEKRAERFVSAKIDPAYR